MLPHTNSLCLNSLSLKAHQSIFRRQLIDLRFFTTNYLIIHSRLADRLLPSSPNKSVKSLTDFTIDAAHELALFIFNVDKKLKLKSVPYFCSRYGADCAVYAREENIFCVSKKDVTAN